MTDIVKTVTIIMMIPKRKAIIYVKIFKIKIFIPRRKCRNAIVTTQIKQVGRFGELRFRNSNIYFRINIWRLFALDGNMAFYYVFKAGGNGVDRSIYLQEKEGNN